MLTGLAFVNVPGLVRIKPGALDRLGLHLSRSGRRRVALLQSAELPEALVTRARVALADVELALDSVEDVAALDAAARPLAALPGLAPSAPGRTELGRSLARCRLVRALHALVAQVSHDDLQGSGEPLSIVLAHAQHGFLDNV